MKISPAVTATAKPVLVAVNGSAESLAALEWATRYATGYKLALRIITAASPSAHDGGDSAGSYLTTYVDPVEMARARLTAAIEVRVAGDDGSAAQPPTD